MVDLDSSLSARFAGTRPDLTLVAIEAAALPVTMLQVDVLAQERKSLPLLNEFVLRFCAVGLGSAQEIAAICGIDASLVESAVADQVASGDMSLSAARQSIALTPQGVRTCEELEAIQPVQKQLPIAFDRLTWAVADYSKNDLITKAEAEEQGMVVLPATRKARIGSGEVTPSGLNALLRGQGGEGSRVEILAVRKLRSSLHRYLPVDLLIFGDVDGREVELSLVVDGDQSSAHDLALAALGGAERLGVRVGKSDKRPMLEKELENLRIDADEGAQEAHERTRDSQSTVTSSLPSVQGIGVLEHPQILEEALTSSRNRLLIISPWLKNAVVDTAFLGKLEGRLRAGCKVHIAHGIGKDDRGSDRRAMERLANLQSRFSQKFSFERLANTHAKVLIFDDVWVSTSFNWLSFRGDPDRTYRMEEGTLVRIPERVAQEYERFVRLIGEQRISQP